MFHRKGTLKSHPLGSAIQKRFSKTEPIDGVKQLTSKNGVLCELGEGKSNKQLICSSPDDGDSKSVAKVWF